MDDLDPIDQQLLELLERPESAWEGGLAELCARGGTEAAELRRRFELLRDSGFVGCPAPEAREAEVPERLGGFELEERLGQGGMGMVFAARDPRLGRRVALKLLRPGQLYFPGARERFQREITAVAKLSHPGIVAVHSVGEEQGLPYFAMELLRGASLDEVIRGLAGRAPEALTGADLWAVVARAAAAPAPPYPAEVFSGPWTDVCCLLARRVAEALEHAHQNGIVHRDVKPSNVIVTADGRVVLLDFGLARPTGVDRVTREGSHVGSLPYMAPEQLRGEPGDARTDVYGLGVLLRELLTLRQPFLAPSGEETRRRILHGDSLALEQGNRAVSWELATVCAMATEPEARRRYAVAADFARDLENVRQRRAIQARPAGALRRAWRWAERRPALATGLLVGLLAAIGTPTAVAIGIAEQRDRARAAEAEQQRKAYQANIAAANAALQSHDAEEVRRRLGDCPPERRGFEWQHLELALDGSLLTLAGHASPVLCVAWSPDGTLLASGDERGEVRLWDAQRGECVARLGEHSGPILVLGFSADGQRLVVDDEQGRADVIELASRRVLGARTHDPIRENLRIAADGESVLAVQSGWRVLELDPRTLAVLREQALEPFGEPPGSPVTTDGRLLCAMSGTDLHVWELATGKHLFELPNVSLTRPSALRLAPAGDLLAVSDGFAHIAIADLRARTLVQRMSDAGKFDALCLDRTGEHVAEAGSDGALRVFDVATGKRLALLFGHAGAVDAIDFCTRRMLLATGGADHTVRIWSPFGSRDCQTLYGHVGIVSHLALAPDGERLLSCSQDGSLRVWDLSTGMPLESKSDYPHHVRALALSGDGRTAWSAFHGTLVASALPGLASAAPWPLPREHVLDLALPARGDLLLAATSDGCLLLDARERKLVCTLPGAAGEQLCCAFDAGGTAAFAGGSDGRVLRWQAPWTAPPRVLVKGGPAVSALALAHEGSSLFVAAGTSVRRIDAASGALAWTRSSSSRVWSLAELASGARVVSGHADGSVVFWDARSGEPMLVRRLGDSAVRALVCDPAGRYVVAGSADGTCQVLRTNSPRPPEDALALGAAGAAMRLHAELRRGARTREEVLSAIEARTDLERGLGERLRTCEMCSLRVPWSQAYECLRRTLGPGLDPEEYRAARRVAEDYRAATQPGNPLARAIVVLASARLGDTGRVLAECAELDPKDLAEYGLCESALHAGWAMALEARGRTPEARAELDVLARLAARPDAAAHDVALWREVEARLGR